MTDLPQTLLEAVRYFADLDICHDYMRQIKWPNGQPVCPACGHDRIGEIKTRPGKLRCNKHSCQKQFRATDGTIFGGSKAPLSAWLVACYSVANRLTVPARELAELVGVTQKTAWKMLRDVHAAESVMKKQSKRPKGWKAFDDLTRKLIQVPKEEVDAKITEGQEARKRRRAKKK